MRTAFEAAERLEARADELTQDSRHAAALHNNDDANGLALAAHHLRRVAAEIRDASLAYWLDTEPSMGVWK